MNTENNRPLRQEIFEPSTTDTVEVTELYGAEPGGIFDFVGLDLKEHTIKTCWGDLRIICDALEDYACILERVASEWDMSNYLAECYRIHAVRCRKIARKYADAIGYDREKALKKCRKKRKSDESDVGRDALELMAGRGRNQSKDEKKPKEAVQTDDLQLQEGYDGQEIY